jgi:glutamine amidotransferase
MLVAVVDLGLGNLRSVERALFRAAGEAKIACTTIVTSDPERARQADKIVVPGQGSFGAAAEGLDCGWRDALREQIELKKPYLGICLGLQLLFDTSEEMPGARGLGVFEGGVVRLPKEAGKTPHMGWNTVAASGRSLLPTEDTYFYFTHTFVVVPRDPALACGITEYGSTRFVSAVAKENLFACQFHPEKSQLAGQALLARFLRS